MKPKKFYITGDTHGDLSRFDSLQLNPNYNNGMIILGDSGFLYSNYFSRHAIAMREQAKRYNMIFYLVRGNHEDRPSNVPALEKKYDFNVMNDVYVDPEYENIRYLIDGKTYDFDGQKALVIGGAYSVDKEWRLLRGLKWFADEQLTNDEMVAIYNEHKDTHFNFILSHTCPYSWRPTHMFLPMIDQSTVDNSMELIFENYKNDFKFDMWLWGHYHENCVCDEKGVMLFDAIYDLAMCQPIDQYTEYDGDYMTWSPAFARREG